MILYSEVYCETVKDIASIKYLYHKCCIISLSELFFILSLQWPHIKPPEEEALVWKHLHHPGDAAGAGGLSAGGLRQGR